LLLGLVLDSNCLRATAYMHRTHSVYRSRCTVPSLCDKYILITPSSCTIQVYLYRTHAACDLLDVCFPVVLL
jgi:hypothetical protein